MWPCALQEMSGPEAGSHLQVLQAQTLLGQQLLCQAHHDSTCCWVGTCCWWWVGVDLAAAITVTTTATKVAVLPLDWCADTAVYSTETQETAAQARDSTSVMQRVQALAKQCSCPNNICMHNLHKLLAGQQCSLPLLAKDMHKMQKQVQCNSKQLAYCVLRNVPLGQQIAPQHSTVCCCRALPCTSW